MFKKYIEYIKDNPKGYWFKAKRYGFGWTPVTRQGWLVLLGYILLVLLFAFALKDNSTPLVVIFTFVLPIMLLTIVLICICYKK